MLAFNMEYLPRIKLMGFVAYKNPWIHFRRITDEFILYFIKSGELHIEERGIPYILKKGDFLILEPHTEHIGIEKHVCDYFYIHFSHPHVEQLPSPDFVLLGRQMFLEESHLEEVNQEESICYFPKYFNLSNKSGFSQTLHSMNELQQLYNRRQFNRSLTSLKFAQIMIETSREYLLKELHNRIAQPNSSMMKVHAVLDYIHQNYSNKITSADIEREFMCNFDYMNRIFHKITGHTITRYVNTVRINQAKELIEATHLSFGEVGYLVGLNDPYYFSKVFKQYVGISPRQYAQSIKQKKGLLEQP
ncbi:AraC family transcriptional regulator [Paenibacillus hexagrammi]|uniref:AraC family transcriptional regulator n=1 Tax=Paenibacillus hexagrammi TaxID=2908839 RepID=A0ABY3SEG2_9BACL|nr:AraC family transcriptional regulator [Paenibacillus sp. YPD9-1]UJF31820.1 AraC family transcriptional regulator [Paenibacillus sp. YPD9-1]